MELKVEISELRKNRLFVGTPMYGGNCTGLYMKSCLDLQTIFFQHQIPLRFSFLFNESLIPRARNYMADEFLRSDCTHLLFLDADIHYDPNDIITLLAMDKDIVGAAYPKKSISWRNIVQTIKKMTPEELEKFNPAELDALVGEYVFNPVPGTKQFSVTEPLEVMEIGNGYMMIKRQVFERFIVEYPHLRYKPDHIGQANFDGSRYIHAFFDTIIDPDSERYLSEDYMFCQHWRAIGGQVWLCPWMGTQHIGTYAFTGNLPAIARYTGAL